MIPGLTCRIYRALDNTSSFRYAKVTDAQVLTRLLDICDLENVVKTDDGLEAVIFTAQGDMRQAINNLQATHQVR